MTIFFLLMGGSLTAGKRIVSHNAKNSMHRNATDDISGIIANAQAKASPTVAPAHVAAAPDAQILNSTNITPSFIESLNNTVIESRKDTMEWDVTKVFNQFVHRQYYSFKETGEHLGYRGWYVIVISRASSDTSWCSKTNMKAYYGYWEYCYQYKLDMLFIPDKLDMLNKLFVSASDSDAEYYIPPRELFKRFNQQKGTGKIISKTSGWLRPTFFRSNGVTKFKIYFGWTGLSPEFQELFKQEGKSTLHDRMELSIQVHQGSVESAAGSGKSMKLIAWWYVMTSRGIPDHQFKEEKIFEWFLTEKPGTALRLDSA